MAINRYNAVLDPYHTPLPRPCSILMHFTMLIGSRFYELNGWKTILHILKNCGVVKSKAVSFRTWYESTLWNLC